MRNVSSLIPRLGWAHRIEPSIFAEAFRHCPHRDKALSFGIQPAPRPAFGRVETFSKRLRRLSWTTSISEFIDQTIRPIVDNMPSINKKRKLDDAAPTPFYAVRSGHKTGVYRTWAECQAQISGFKGAQFKKFETKQDADDFVAGRATKPMPADPNKPQKFYAVAVGNKPGIYTDWTEAHKAFEGCKGMKQKSFKTREEAVDYIKIHGDEAGQKAIENEISQPPVKKAKTATTNKTIADGCLEIYTDGSSRGNGKAGAAAGVGVYFGDNDPRNVCERLEGDPQTNQRAELTAILRAMQKVSVDQDIEIVTDSRYSLSCVTEWYKNWAKNGWQTSGKEEVKNKDLIQAIRAKVEDRDASRTRTSFRWVRGHNDDHGNVEADKLAVAGAALPRRK